MRTDKNTATNLREQGKSYNEIANILKVPKSTLSVWLRDIKMSPEIRKKFWNDVKQRQAKSITEFNKKQGEKARKNAQEIQESAAKTINALSKKDLLLIGAALYWGEGYKKSRWTLAFTNSDPLMVKIIMKRIRL